MPQLVPFFFLHEVTNAFFLLVVLIILLSNYILPSFIQVFLSRVFLSKL